jgi:hypothetical protein
MSDCAMYYGLKMVWHLLAKYKIYELFLQYIPTQESEWLLLVL